jgi:hypothetical protein
MMNGIFYRLQRLQSALTYARVARYALDQAWPEIIGNQPEHFAWLQRMQVDLNALYELADSQIRQLETDTVKYQISISETRVLATDFQAGQYYSTPAGRIGLAIGPGELVMPAAPGAPHLSETVSYGYVVTLRAY